MCYYVKALLASVKNLLVGQISADSSSWFYPSGELQVCCGKSFTLIMVFYFARSAQRYAQKQTDSLICIGHSSAGLKGQRLKVHLYLNAITSCQVSSVNTLTYGLVLGDI